MFTDAQTKGKLVRQRPRGVVRTVADLRVGPVGRWPKTKNVKLGRTSGPAKRFMRHIISYSIVKYRQMTGLISQYFGSESSLNPPLVPADKVVKVLTQTISARGLTSIRSKVGSNLRHLAETRSRFSNKCYVPDRIKSHLPVCRWDDSITFTV